MKYLLLVVLWLFSGCYAYALPKDIRKFEDGDNVCYTYGEFSGISCVKRSKKHIQKKKGKFAGEYHYDPCKDGVPLAHCPEQQRKNK